MTFQRFFERTLIINIMKIKNFLLIFFLIILLNACSNHITLKILRVGFIPSENMAQVLANAQPLIDLMSKKLNMEIQPFVATDYTSVVEAFRAGKLDVGFLSPAAYVMAKQQADVIGILKSHRHGSPYYYAAIITRTDSKINSLKDLKNKSFAFGDPLSTTGHIFPKKMFLNVGMNPDTAFKNIIYSGGHDATVLAVLNKKVDAGATYSNNTRGDDASWHQFLRPEEAKLIKAIDYSEPIPSDNITVRATLGKELIDKITKIFIDYSNDKEGQALMRELYYLDGFIPSTDKDFESVREAFDIAGIDISEAMSKK